MDHSWAELHVSDLMAIAVVFKDNILQHLAVVKIWASLSHYCRVFSMEEQRHACWLSPRHNRDSLHPGLAPLMDSSNFSENTCYLATFKADGANSNSPSPHAKQGQEQAQATGKHNLQRLVPYRQEREGYQWPHWISLPL